MTTRAAILADGALRTMSTTDTDVLAWAVADCHVDDAATMRSMLAWLTDGPTVYDLMVMDHGFDPLADNVLPFRSSRP